MGHTSSTAFDDPVTLQNMSTLIAELCDYHVDIGKSMGIRKIIITSVETQGQGQQVNFVDLETTGHPESIGGFPPTGALVGDPEYDDLQALRSSLGPPFTFFTEEKSSEYNHDQFLLVNINYKSRLVQTPTASVRWSFGSKESREAPGVYSASDLGKVAFQTDEDSWWVLDNIEPATSTNYTPRWLSQDLQAQIVAGILNQRVILFFLPDGPSSNFFPFLSQFRDEFLGREPGDQRALFDIYGDFADTGWMSPAAQFSYPSHQDPQFIADSLPPNWPQIPDHDFGSLGLFPSLTALTAAGFAVEDIGRSVSYKDEQGLPYTVALLAISPNEFTPPLPWTIQVAATPFEDHEFIYHELPPGQPPPNNYGGTGNPDLLGAFRVRSASYTGRILITEFQTED